ncbi:MAG TPA: multicopper oxidase domain-containing protein [Opitutaceae bacterium]|nr:multicopper oxidase domain-containing protein [Opitutaceae bacterium]
MLTGSLRFPLFLLFFACFVPVTWAQLRTVDYDLTVEKKLQAPAGKSVPVLTLNGTLPGPVLRFTEGDVARVRVHNRLKDETTSIHWHGLLLPNEQDGVPGLTTPPIQPGTTHVFEFPIRQAGTYWYHSHTMLQEQQGVIGAIVIAPRDREPQPADRDHVLLLSDWTNENPDEVMRTLKRGSIYYGLKKGTLPTLWGAYRAGMLKDYVSREWGRMPPMDISDVAYDAFLVNGKRRISLEGNAGEVIRLRVINGSAATYFYVQSSTGPMTIVAADGPPVAPVAVQTLLVAIAETYDILITLPESGRAEVRATAQDGSGHASAVFGPDDSTVPAPTALRRPNNYSMDDMLLAALEEAESIEEPEAEQGERNEHPAHGNAVHSAPLVAGEENPRPLSPYRLLRSPGVTTLPQQQATRTLTLRMTGDMERYIWSFNGKTLHEDPVIAVRRGENIRMELINDTMMHHPIHLHGHFFRLLQGQGAHAPLKHTVDVPPMGKRVIEFDANESGDWMLHCHVLYHMMAGMTRIVSYAEQGGPHHPHHPDLSEEHEHPYLFWGEAALLSQWTRGELVMANDRNDFILDWEAGWEKVPETEWRAGVRYSRYIDPNLSYFGGAEWGNEHEVKDRALIGVQYRLPFLVESRTWLDSQGDVRIALEKSFQLTNRWSLSVEVRYDTGSGWEWRSGLAYLLGKPVSLAVEYHDSYGWGAGLHWRF